MNPKAQLVNTVLAWTDKEGPSTLKQIAAGIGASETSIRVALRKFPSQWECCQKLGAQWGANYRWKLVYSRRYEAPRNILPDVWNDPNFRGYGTVPKQGNAPKPKAAFGHHRKKFNEKPMNCH